MDGAVEAQSGASTEFGELGGRAFLAGPGGYEHEEIGACADRVVWTRRTLGVHDDDSAGGLKCFGDAGEQRDGLVIPPVMQNVDEQGRVATRWYGGEGVASDDLDAVMAGCAGDDLGQVEQDAVEVRMRAEETRE